MLMLSLQFTPNSKKYLTFQNKGIIYQYKTLAFGMSVSLRVFSKMMRFVIKPLRLQGIRLVYYLVDICVLGTTKEEATNHTQIVLSHMESLGFLINFQKSVLAPFQQQEFLGFEFNTKNMQIALPVKKMSKLMIRIKQAIKAKPHQYNCRWYVSMMGKMTSMIPAIGEALLHIRYMQRDLSLTLSKHLQNWDAPMTLSNDSKNELQW